MLNEIYLLNSKITTTNYGGENSFLIGNIPIYNGITYAIYEAFKIRLTSLFKWEGLDIPSWMLEKKLIEYGSLAVVKNKGKVYFVNYSINGTPNVYNQPLSIRILEPYSPLHNKVFNEFDILYNDSEGRGYISKTMKYFEKLDVILLKLDNEVAYIGDKIVINNTQPSENIVEELNVSTKLASNEKAIALGNGLPSASKEQQVIISNPKTQELIDVANFTIKQIKELLGAPLEAKEKSERTISSEINMPNAYQSLTLINMLSTREVIANKYGLKVEVNLQNLYEGEEEENESLNK